MAVALALTVHHNDGYVRACTDFRLDVPYPLHRKSISGRTMDFTIDLDTSVEIIPRNTPFSEIPVQGCPECQDYSWKAKYGFISMNVKDFNFPTDGMNEAGLSAAALMLYSTKFANKSSLHASTKPIVTSYVAYTLGNYATVKEAREGLNDVMLGPIDAYVMDAVAKMNFPYAFIPIHLALHDKNGDSAVIEVVNGKTHFYDNPNGVMTNDPIFPKQLQALEKFRNTSRMGTVSTYPGDYSSTSRFIRSTVLRDQIKDEKWPAGASYSHTSSETQKIINWAGNIIGTVSLPLGSETTQWSVIRDHSASVWYFKSAEEQYLNRIDLKKIDFNNMTSRNEIPLRSNAWFNDRTDEMIGRASSRSHSIDLPPRSVIERLVKDVGASTTLNLSLKDTRSVPLLYGGIFGFAFVVTLTAFKALIRRQHRRQYSAITGVESFHGV